MTALEDRKDQEKLPPPELLPSPSLGSWLAGSGGTLVISTYQSARILFLSGLDTGEVVGLDRIVGSAMGLAAAADCLWVSNKEQAWRFVNVGAARLPDDAHISSLWTSGADDVGQETTTTPPVLTDYDGIFMPRMGAMLGPVDAHDLLSRVSHADRKYELLFVNTNYSCIASVDPHHNFRPVWKPPFISSLSMEDRCHLNGMGARDGKLAYVTACSTTDTPMGWRAVRNGGGVLIDIQTSEIICTGLTMPHSPRWHDGRVWLLNSGEGQFGYVDPAAPASERRFVPVLDCPGFARGLTIVGDHAVIGLSRMRANSFAADMPLTEKLEKRRVQQRCGLLLFNLKTGVLDHWLTITGSVTELYDVAFLPGLRRPYSPGFSHPRLHRYLLNIPNTPFDITPPRPFPSTDTGANDVQAVEPLSEKIIADQSLAAQEI